MFLRTYGEKKISEKNSRVGRRGSVLPQSNDPHENPEPGCIRSYYSRAFNAGAVTNNINIRNDHSRRRYNTCIIDCIVCVLVMIIIIVRGYITIISGTRLRICTLDVLNYGATANASNAHCAEFTNIITFL